MSILNDIVNCAEKRFGISTLKPYQILVTHRILEQDSGGCVPEDEIRNQIVILPTGTGKSLCFQIPAVLISGITIIVYPLIALMNDQKRRFDSSKIDCVVLKGGQTVEVRDSVFISLDNGTKIVITNPETLNQPKVYSRLAKYKIGLFVCDEAHVVSGWGKTFRPEYLKLGETLRKLKPRQILGFTATATEETVRDIVKVLFGKRPLIVRGDADRENIIYRAHPCVSVLQGICELVENSPKPALVFCRTREETRLNCLRTKRILKDVPMRYYHAGLSGDERRSLEKWFFDSHDGVLFATCAYGLGVDKPDIRTVIHTSAPDSVLDFLQESGRAGRDGQESDSYVLIDRNRVKGREEKSEVVRIFVSDECRRQQLLEALGQQKSECTGCDVCLGECKSVVTGEKEIIGAVKLHPFRYDLNLLSIVLGGIRNGSANHRERVLNPYFNSLWFMDGQCIRDTVRELIKTENHQERPLTEVFSRLVKFPGNGLFKVYSKYDRIKKRWKNGFFRLLRNIFNK